MSSACSPGIAWDEKRRRLFVTGKWWHKLYQVKLRRSSTITLEKVRSQFRPREPYSYLPLQHTLVLLDAGSDSPHVSSWPSAMCRRVRHAYLQRIALAEYCAEQPRSVLTGRSAQHVLDVEFHQPTRQAQRLRLVQHRVCREGMHDFILEPTASCTCLQERWRNLMIDLPRAATVCAGHTRVALLA